MTRFERDIEKMVEDDSAAREILEKRAAELESLQRQGKAEKNGFKRTCIAQEYKRLKAEYDKLDAMF